jgi:hypothetical protein
MINLVLENPIMIFLATVYSGIIIYVFIRVIAFGITKSVLQGRMSFYKEYKNKLLRRNNYDK